MAFPFAAIYATGAFTFAVLLLVIMLGLYASKVIDRRILILFLLGFLIGYVWEVAHAVAPNDFIRLKDKSVEACFPTDTLYPIVHALGDAFLFIMGLLLVYLLKIPLHSPWALVVMMVWGLSIAVIAETSSNGAYWHYSENIPANPVIYRLNNGIGYTLWPFLEWMFAPVLFWICALLVFRFVTP